MQIVHLLIHLFHVFVTFTNYLHHVHILFIFNWYTLIKSNEAIKINFFIIARVPQGTWALLILGEILMPKKTLHPPQCLFISGYMSSFFSRSRLIASISSFRDNILASKSDTILAHSTSSLLMCSGASPSNL